MKLGLTSLILAAAAMEASAYNVDEVVGAWTPAGDAGGNADLAVERHTAWAKNGEREPTRATLKFFNWNEMVDQVIKSLDDAKKQ